MASGYSKIPAARSEPYTLEKLAWYTDRFHPMNSEDADSSSDEARVLIKAPAADRATGAPDRKTQKMPFRTRRSFTRGTPRGLFGSIGLMAAHSWSVNSGRMIRGSSLSA